MVLRKVIDSWLLRGRGRVFIFFLAVLGSLWDLSSLNPCPLQWQCRVLTIGLPGDSLEAEF